MRLAGFTCIAVVLSRFLAVCTKSSNQKCACLIGDMKIIYSSSLSNQEQIGVLITGECLPVAYGSSNTNWLPVTFRKNIIFHHLSVVGFIRNDTDVVLRSCSDKPGSLFVTQSTRAPTNLVDKTSVSPGISATSTEVFIPGTSKSMFLNGTTATMPTRATTLIVDHGSTTLPGIVSTGTPITNTGSISDLCQGVQCHSYRKCVADPNPRCVCNNFRNGSHCEFCGQNKCLFGTCLSVSGSLRCICDNGFTGDQCDQQHVCGSSESSIGGECYKLNYFYETCKENLCTNISNTQCLVNSQGIYCLCSETFDPASQTPCGCPVGHIRRLDGSCVEIDCRGVTSCKHGRCFLETFYSYGCICDEGWQGDNCDVPDNACGNNHCHNNGTCVRDPNPRCDCPDGWSGPNCTTCGNTPCDHGNCIAYSGKQPFCVCDKEFTGPECNAVSNCNGQTFGGHCYNDDSGEFQQCVENVCGPGEHCVVALHTYMNDMYCACKENATLSYLTSDCGCPVRSLKSWKGQCTYLMI